jgi:hypothetical protein
MEHVGIDVYKKQRQICLITEAGEVLHQRIHTYSGPQCGPVKRNL